MSANRLQEATFFETPLAFRAWLEQHHRRADELLVGFYKKDSGIPSITLPESVDQALCFGWIDGVRRRLDERRYTIRFTPRRMRSIWSAVNISRVAELKKLSLMQPSGLDAFERRSDAKSGIYSYEQKESATLAPDDQRKLQTNKKAWAFFQAQPPGYKRLVIYRIVSARKDETRRTRLAALITASVAGRRL